MSQEDAEEKIKSILDECSERVLEWAMTDLHRAVENAEKNLKEKLEAVKQAMAIPVPPNVDVLKILAEGGVLRSAEIEKDSDFEETIYVSFRSFHLFYPSEIQLRRHGKYRITVLIERIGDVKVR